LATAGEQQQQEQEQEQEQLPPRQQLNSRPSRQPSIQQHLDTLGAAMTRQPSLHRLLSCRRINQSQSRLDVSPSLVRATSGTATAAAAAGSTATLSLDVSVAAAASTGTADAVPSNGGLPIIQQPGAAGDNDDDWDDDEATCEICFDAVAVVALQDCRHTLCIRCCKEMCKLHHFKPALCPYCRQIICGFERAAGPFIP
jgi:hypothetical protein